MDKTETLQCLRKIAVEDDRPAFGKLYGHYFRKLFIFCLSIVRSKESAEEIVNDVFVHLWEKRAILREIENADVYFYVAVKNRSLDYIRKMPLFYAEDISTLSGESIAFALDPEQLMITAEMKKKIEAAVDQLPPRCKLIFKLIKEDGLKYKEVASVLDLSIKTVEAQLTIAMKKLTTAILFSSDIRVKQRSDDTGS